MNDATNNNSLDKHVHLSGMHAARIACALSALVVSTWFALGAREAIDTQRATSIVSRGSIATPAEEREVSSLVRDARLLNPDKEPQILLAEVEIERGHDALAQRLLEPITGSEPQNIQAWFKLAVASPHNMALGNRTLRRIQQLEPRLP